MMLRLRIPLSIRDSGTNCVYARWTANPNRATDAKYTVVHAGGSATHTVDQQSGGGAWNLLGTYTFNPGTAHKVELTDQANGYVVADAIRLVATNVAPTVSIAAPAASAVFNAGATIAVTANAADTDGTITQVAFFANGSPVGTATASPYTVNWTPAAGAYSLTAVATDNNGATTTSAAVAVMVNALPGVTITSPAANATFTAPASITLTATASDPDGTIAQVQYFANGSPIGTATASPYTFVWTNVATGAYSLTAVATDNLGATMTSSAVPITVSAVQAKLYFIHTDHLNTPRLVADETQTTVWKWEQQEPFGVNAANEDPDADAVAFEFNLRFPGQYFDKETNAHYNYFRDYDPGIGRYVQSDPVGLAGGLNTYAYVNGSPLRYTDPLGLLNLVVGGGGAFAGGIAGSSFSAQGDIESGGYYNFQSGEYGAFQTTGGSSGFEAGGTNGPYGGAFAGAGLTIGLVSGSVENVGGTFQNLNIQIPGTSVGIIVYYDPNNRFQGAGITIGPGGGAGLTRTNTRLFPRRKPDSGGQVCWP